MGGYQDRDWEIVDYGLYRLDDSDFMVRGPRPDNMEKGNYFVCLGAAQTFGCFCEKPYPILLQEKLNIQALNLGIAGAGPYYFLKHDRLLEYVNNARFAIIQVMSGRSESNSVFDSGGGEHLKRRSDGAMIGADDAYQQLLQEKTGWRKLLFWRKKHDVEQIVAETRHNWVNNYKSLFEKIEVPTILLWFSKRKPEYKESYAHAWSLFGEFPQLVNSDMINQINRCSDEYVECTSSRGSPQLLISRFTGEPTTMDPANARKDLGTGERQSHNSYYPSPEMQIDAANLLEPVCEKYVSGVLPNA